MLNRTATCYIPHIFPVSNLNKRSPDLTLRCSWDVCPLPIFLTAWDREFALKQFTQNLQKRLQLLLCWQQNHIPVCFQKIASRSWNRDTTWHRGILFGPLMFPLLCIFQKSFSNVSLCFFLSPCNCSSPAALVIPEPENLNLRVFQYFSFKGHNKRCWWLKS